MRSIDIATPKAYNDHNVFFCLFVLFLYTPFRIGYFVDIWYHSPFIQTKVYSNVMQLAKAMLILRKFETGLLKEERAQKKKQAITPQCCAPIMCNYFNFFFICLFVLVLIWVLHLILVSYICVLMLICELSFFWSQRNNDIGHMISIAIIQLLPKRAAFILFISAPLFALFLSLWVSIVIFDCPLQWFL